MEHSKELNQIRAALKGKKLYVVPYMHADWAWCHTREWHARRYIAVFEDVIEQMRRGIGYKWYMDCFCTEILPLLERRPDLIPELREFVEKGDVQIAGGFSNVRPNMVGDEAYVRNMIIGRRRFEELFPGAENIVHGESVDVALGHPQIPQLIAKGGFRYYRAGRPYEVLEKKGLRREFIWEGLDGTRVLVWWGEYGGMWTPDAVRKLRDSIDDWDGLVKQLYETELEQYQRNTGVDVMWVAQGCDDVLPLKAFNSDLDVPLPEIIEKWNENEASEMRFAGPNEFFRELERQSERIQVHRGAVDIADVSYNVAWGGEKGLVEKRLRSSERLCEAETWMLLAQLCGGEPARELQPLWEEALNASAHATAWLFAKDFDELYARIEKAILDADALKRRALRSLAERAEKRDGAIAVAFNSLAREREAVVSVTVPSGKTEGMFFEDGDGNRLPFQMLKAYEYTDSVWEHEALVRVRVPALGYTQICVRGVPVDCRLGGVFKRAERPKKIDASQPFAVDNGVLRLEFEGGRLVRIFDVRENRMQPADGESAWNDLVFTEVDTDNGILHAGPTVGESVVRFSSVALLEEGPVRWRVRLEGSDGRVQYVQEMMLNADSRDIQMRVHFDWPVSRGRLSCRIPTTGDCVLRGGIPFGSEIKDVDSEPYGDDMHRQWKGLFCAKDYVRAVSGEASAALISVEGDRYYFFDRERATLSYVLLNSARMIEDTWEDSVSRRSIESVGRHEIRYVIRIGESGELDRHVAQAARAARNPVEVTIPYARVEGATLPAARAFMQVTPENLEMTAFYREGEDALLRVYETDGVETRTAIRLPCAVKSAGTENFIGESDGRALCVDRCEVSFVAKPHEIITIRLRLEESYDFDR